MGNWQHDRSMAYARLDERAFRRIEKFTDKKDEWTEWRAQVIEAVRECDKTFADDLVKFEKKEAPIVDTDLSVCQQQLSATLQSRLINLTGKEAFAIVRAAQGQGVEAWRQLSMRFDPQTDARFALLLIAVVSYKIGAKQDVQSGLVKWETLLLSLERDRNEKLSPTIRRALLLNIWPNLIQPRLLEHLDRLLDYKQVREKIVSSSSPREIRMLWTVASSTAAFSPFSRTTRRKWRRATPKKKMRCTLRRWQTSYAAGATRRVILSVAAKWLRPVGEGFHSGPASFPVTAVRLR